MNFAEQDRDYSDKDEEQLEDEEELEDEVMMITASTSTASKLPFSSSPPNSPSSSSSSSSSSKYRDFMFQKQNLWSPSPSDQYSQKDQQLNFENNKLDFMDLSLGSNNNNNETSGGSSSSIEKEHMFDKVVTPSDVGKLNRLVIPKQHAEKYFPLDSSSNEKGLLLNFEDRNGKPWRFRYSYWNSSQSYVLTKGWSRFVKEKKLDAGDIVSFQRGVGESAKHNLYIDWRRRPNAPDPTSFTQFDLQNQLHFPQSSAVRWGRLYSLPQPLSPSSMYRPPYDHQSHQFQHHLNNYSIQPYHHHHNQHRHHHNYHPPQQTNYGNAVSQQYYLRPPPPGTLQFGGVQGDQQAQMVIDSVPVVHGRSVGKRLRLFGVNMECSTQDHHQIHDQYQSFSSSPDSIQQQQQVGGGGSFSAHHIFSSSVIPQAVVGRGSSSSGAASISATEADSRKGKSKSSLSFDLDL